MTAATFDYIACGLVIFTAIMNVVTVWSLHRSLRLMEGRETWFQRWRGK